MNSASAKSEYLLIFRGIDWARTLPPAEIKEVMVAWMAWSERLAAEGRSTARRSLMTTGKVVSGKERHVSDGPFAEAKEAVAGYFLLEVADLDEAVAIAKECPTLPYGVTVEVREMPRDCFASHLATASLEEIAGFFGIDHDPEPSAAVAESVL